MQIYVFFFFFQAEDGIRDYDVTGVQTCALPISTELFDRQKDAVGQGERTILVYIELSGNVHIANGVEEFEQLAASSGLNIIQSLTLKRSFASARFFLGKGKVEELSELVSDNEIDLVILSPNLSPSQERNLEKSLQCQIGRASWRERV